MIAPATHDASGTLFELGLVVVGLALLSRLASRWKFSAIPFYLLAGLAFGNGGLSPLPLSGDFVRTGAGIGGLLMLFMLGLEFTGDELKQNLRTGMPSGLADLLLNFPPGLIAGLLMGWSPLAAVLLGGVTYISSSGVAAKLLSDMQRLQHAEAPAVLSVLVLEDLAMAVYLPLVGVLLVGGEPRRMVFSVLAALSAVFVALLIAVRYGERLSRLVAHESDEIILLTVFGAVLLVAGLSERIHVSAAVGAFLVGTAVSGPIAEQSYRLIAPLRDLFAATFFFFFGLEIDPVPLIHMLLPAFILAGVSVATKMATGYWAARRTGADRRGRLLAGAALVARGEFSIVIAGLGVALEPQIGSLAAAYVLLLAVAGPLLARVAR
jgi:CPA2 family monovalent cation:H+ antiporter-2